MGAALLEAHRLTGDVKYADGVRKIASVLEQRAVRHNGDGARWSFTTDVIAGTAGVGANHLLAVADQSGEGCIVFHYEADGKKGEPLLGWCHGPPGTSRLFERLAEVTGDAKWREWVLRGARSVVERGEKARALWDNSSLCCGTAGVGDFFLDLYRSTGDKQWLEHARTLATDIAGRAKRSPDGTVSWGAPSRTANPDLRTDESSLMQGASGIWLFLLRFDAAEKKREIAVRLADTPFR